MADAAVGPSGTAASTLRGSAWQVAARLASIVLQGGAFAVIARILGPEALGGFAGAFALASLFGAASEFGLQNTVVVELGGRPTAAPAILAQAMVASATLGAGGLLIALPATLAFADDAAVAFLALVPWALLSRLSTPGAAWWQSHLDFRRIFLGEAIGRGSAFAGLVALAVAAPGVSTRASVVAAGAILALGAVVQLAVVLPAAALRAGIGAGRLVAGARRLVVVAAPLGIVSAISLIHVRSDQVLLELLGHGGEELGRYAVAYRVVEGAAGVLGAVAVVGFSVLSRSAVQERAHLSRANARLVAIVGLAGSLGVVLAAPVLVRVVGGAGFDGAVWPTRLLSVVVLVSVLNMVPSLTVVLQRASRRLLPVGLAVVAANIALNLALIPHLGATGSAVATITTELAGLALVTRIAEQELPGSQRPLDAVLVVAASGLALVGFTVHQPAVVVAGCGLAAAILVAMVRQVTWTGGDRAAGGA